MKERVLEYCQDNQLLDKGDSIIVGVSGGADSICLLDLFIDIAKEYELNLTAVHINHKMRGLDAQEDQEYVEEFCRQRKITCIVFAKDIKVLAKEEGITLEEAGRLYRYQCFEQVLANRGANKIAVAHHANDQAETVLFHLARGTGILGLTGMAPKRNEIIRPLLCVTRQDILAYLQEKDLKYCIDVTNEDTIYTRNKIRHQLVPLMEEVNQRAVTHICETAKMARESLDLVNSLVDQALMDQVRIRQGNYNIELAGFVKLPMLIRKELIKRILILLSNTGKNIGVVHIESVNALVNKGVGRCLSLPYGVWAQREYEEICLGKGEREEIAVDFDYKLEAPGEYRLEHLKSFVTLEILSIDKNLKIPKNKYTKAFDYDKIKGDLHIRKRQQGDRIVINDQGQSKSLKKYLIDEKVSAGNRDSMPVLAVNSSILWVIGYRIGADYKITEDTKNIILIKYNTDEKE